MVFLLWDEQAGRGKLALRLGHWFGTSAQFWLNLQAAYEIEIAKQTAGAKIARLPRRPAA